LLSGFFSEVGPYTGSAVLTDAATGAVDMTMPKVNGDVYVTAPDGSGGWYVGGYFDAVGNEQIQNLAHINPIRRSIQIGNLTPTILLPP
jgi:hypothetical protein